jgi:two-component system, NarL family, response regulator, fimbrial Z protein, FimZ
MKKKILIADHSVLRLGTALVLRNQLEDTFIDHAENYKEVKQKLHEERFDLLILDIEMRGNVSKLMIKELKHIQEDLLILIFSSQKENIAAEYIQEGAEGYLNKLSSEKNFMNAVQTIFDGGHYYTPQLMDYINNTFHKKDINEILSERELEVLKLLIDGNGNLEICNILDLQMTTVSTYKRRIYEKLEVRNLLDVIRIYGKNICKL